MAKKKASLAGRGADILFGSGAPPTPPVPSDETDDVTASDDIAAIVNTPTALPPRAYDFPSPSDDDGDMASQPNVVVAPRPVVMPSPSPIQPAISTGGTVSNPTSTPPSPGTIVVPPTTTGSIVTIPTAPPAAGSGATTRPPSAPPPPTPPPNVITSPPISAGGSAVVTPPPQPPPMFPTPPPAASSSGSAAGQGTGLIVSDVLRLAAQISAERVAAEEAAQKAKEQIVVDPAIVKALRQQLFEETESLYHKTTDVVSSSPKVTEFCFDLLKKARLNLLSSSTAGDLAQAEYYVQLVRTKLNRSADPIPDSARGMLRFIALEHAVIFLICATLALLPFGLSLFTLAPSLSGSPLFTAFVALIAAAGWGGVGGVIGTLYSLPWYIQMREYDPAFNADYITRPIKGFMVGGIMALIFLAGLASISGLQTTGAQGTTTGGPPSGSLGFALVYLLGALGGFKQEYVFELFDGILKAVFRQPEKPRQLDSNKV